MPFLAISQMKSTAKYRKNENSEKQAVHSKVLHPNTIAQLKSGNITTKLDSLMNEFDYGDGMEPDYSYQFTYDDNGNVVQVIENIEGDIYINTFTYDSKNNAISYLSKYDDPEFPSPYNIYQIDYTYNAEGLVESEISYNYDGNDKEIEVKYESIYTNGLLTEFLSYDWDATANDWVISDSWSRSTFTYTQDGKQAVSSLFFYNSSTGEYELDDKWCAVYNGDELITMVDSNYVASSNSFVPDIKTEYVHDANGNSTQETNYDWNTSSNEWKVSFRYTYTYNLSITTEETTYATAELFSTDALFYNVNVPTTSKYELYYNNAWLHKGNATYYYSSFNGNSADISQNINASATSPNPARTTVEFSSKNTIDFITLIDATGNHVLTTVETTVNVSDLPTGVYFYQLNTKKGLETGKLVIE